MKETIKIRAEVNEIETEKIEKKIRKSKGLLFEKLKLINHQLDSRKKRGCSKSEMKEKIQLTSSSIKDIYINKLDNIQEMDKFLEYNLLKLSQEEIGISN